MKTNTDQENQTSWFRRIFTKSAAPTETPVPTPAAPAPKPARNRKVLVVDDDPLFLKLTSTHLENEGFEVITAKDGCEAIEAARKQKPHVMVLDVNLPQDVTGVPWDGFRVISWLRHFETLKHIPVVMTSGGDPVKSTRMAMNSGATAFFHKRMSPAHLLTLVNFTLLRRPAKATAAESSFQI
jgi:DNA-binding response OmpR family regulator